MKSVTIHEAKTKLPALLAEIETRGERFVICRNGKPVADLLPHQKVDRLQTDPFLSQVEETGDLTEPLTEEDWPLG